MRKAWCRDSVHRESMQGSGSQQDEANGGTVRPTIVLVDPDDHARRALHLLLQGRGYEVRTYAALPDIDDLYVRRTKWLIVAADMLPSGWVAELCMTGWQGRAFILTDGGAIVSAYGDDGVEPYGLLPFHAWIGLIDSR